MCRYVKIISAISSGKISGFFVGLTPTGLWPVMSRVLEAGCSSVCGKHPSTKIFKYFNALKPVHHQKCAELKCPRARYLVCNIAVKKDPSWVYHNVTPVCDFRKRVGVLETKPV